MLQLIRGALVVVVVVFVGILVEILLDFLRID